MYYPFKRAIDVLGAAVGLLILFPVLVTVALTICWKMGGPVLFRQTRPGRDGRPFSILKFRTMRNAVDRDGALLSDDQRLTALGRTLRSTSLDELPELWNVLLGEMSLVGPRPLLMEYLGRYTPLQARRNEVRPGVTGLAQINGRNAISWEEKFSLDVFYVDNASLWLDMKILFLTIWRVVRRDGISAFGDATMPEFMGSVGTAMTPDD
jgi:lipopolysaccharide/colanic/teichoic acid biosynthesis glycosyltransferase